jgi:hypothetical protein
MGVSIQQWRATIGQWSDGRPRKCLTVANAIARKRQQDIHKWFRILVLVSLLVIGCVELNPGPNNAQVRSEIGHGIRSHLLHKIFLENIVEKSCW